MSSFRDVGYDGLQLNANQYEDYLDDPSRFIDEFPLQGTASGLITGAVINDAGVAKLRRLFSFGRAVKTDLIILVISEKKSEAADHKPLESLAAEMSEIGKEALDMGLKLSIHNHFNNPLMKKPDLDVFFDAVDPGTVGLTIDTAHLVKSDVFDIADIIRSFPDHIDNFHLKDYKDGDFKVLGDGEIDFAPVFQAIKEIGYDGWVSTDEESGADLSSAMESCLSFMKKGLA
jgi:inosose dehydratase